MDQTALLDVIAVETYLKGVFADFRGPVAVEKFASGQSNPTFRLSSPSGEYVLRRKPPGELLKSAHAVDREFRVQKALQGSDVPVAEMYALCEDEDVIGSMFYVMAFMPGRNFNDPALPELGQQERGAIYDEMNRVLAALHCIDPDAVGLGDFGRPGNYFARQVDRWTKQYFASETEAIPQMNELIDWIGRNVPADDGMVTLVHGDYRLDNLIFAADRPEIVAVLDWELSTLGHPFADLAYQCMQWRMPQGPEGRGLAGIDRAALGIPSEKDYVATYCRRRGIAGIVNFSFCLAFCFFRMAAILQGVKRRALDGNASSPELAMKMSRFVPLLAAGGLEAAHDA